MKTLLSIAMVASLAAFSNSVLADEGADLYTAKTCNTCHGADAKTPIAPNYPKLAGQNKDYLIQQVKDIRDGKRTNGQTAAMKGIVAALTDDEIEKIATYISGLE